MFGKCFTFAGNVAKSISIAFMQKCVAKLLTELIKIVFLPEMKLGSKIM
jgi:hypothetical protein